MNSYVCIENTREKKKAAREENDVVIKIDDEMQMSLLNVD